MAALNWGIGGIFLLAVPAIVFVRWRDLIWLPDATGRPALLLLFGAMIAAGIMIVAGRKWVAGEWKIGLLFDVVAYAMLASFDFYEAAIVKQARKTRSTNSSNFGFGDAAQQRHDRQNYEDSIRELQELGHLSPDETPPKPDHAPRYDDEGPLGLNFYKTLVSGNSMENLDLPRTFIGRSEVGPISFKNSNLAQSTFCWNDFQNVDFTNADLSKSDLRASVFIHVNFTNANLSNCDLRRSTFQDCDFRLAKMNGTKLTRRQSKIYDFSERQIQEIDWQEHDGDSPDGG